MLFVLLPAISSALDFPVNSVVHLSKNTNNNQVHYGVDVDADCRPATRRPVNVYWLMLENGPEVLEGLRLWEQPGYGVRQPEEITYTEYGGRFHFRIRGVPGKEVSEITHDE